MGRDKVIEGLEAMREFFGLGLPSKMQVYEAYHNILTDAIAMLKEQEAKTGKWIPVTNGRGGMECSICHNYAPSCQNGTEYLSTYCPNCGAKMECR